MSNAEEFYKKGLISKENRAWDEAISYFTKAIEQNTSFADAYFQRSVAYYWKDNMDKSIYDCKKSIGLNPEHIEAYYSLGRLYEKAGRNQDAINTYNIFLEKASPSDFAKKIKDTQERLEKLR
ncbi:tetratricopeptide repeat protein [bacterium]|nr:tetratricopeptide repeat protein [bacterium]